MIYQKTIPIEDKQIIVNCSDLNCNWILVHNGDTALSIKKIEGRAGKLETCNIIFEALTKEECLAEIKRLNLKYVEEKKEELILNQPTPKQSPTNNISIFDLLKLSA